MWKRRPRRCCRKKIRSTQIHHPRRRSILCRRLHRLCSQYTVSSRLRTQWLAFDSFVSLVVHALAFSGRNEGFASTLHTSAFVSMLRTFGSSLIASSSFTPSPFTPPFCSQLY